MASNFPILTKIFDLQIWLMPQIPNFPRIHRYTLGIRLENELFELRNFCIKAINKINTETEIKNASATLDGFRMSLRLAKELGYISNKKYLYILENLTEIGKMLGGWIKKIEDEKKGQPLG